MTDPKNNDRIKRKNTRISQTVTENKGLLVNQNYIEGSTINKRTEELQSLDDFIEVYGKNIVPIVNASVIEAKIDQTFMKRFKSRDPNLENLDVINAKKEKYSLLEILYLLINKDFVAKNIFIKLKRPLKKLLIY